MRVAKRVLWSLPRDSETVRIGDAPGDLELGETYCLG
jgi:hypothetical protein